jgi:hypothetical protein
MVDQVNVVCGDFNRFMENMNPQIVESLRRRLCNKGGGDYIVCYGGRNDTARVQGCYSVPADRKLLMSEDMLGVAYGQQHNGQRRHRVGPDPTIPWPSNHPWLWGRMIVGEGDQRRQLCVATWNVMCRGAARKGHIPSNPEWTPERADIQYADVIIELALRLTSNEPWDIVCLQEASPGEVMVGSQGGEPVYKKISDGYFTADALTRHIRTVLADQKGQLDDPTRFRVMKAPKFTKASIPDKNLRTTWLIAREDYGRVILLRASAVNKARLQKTSSRAQRPMRHGHSAKIPMYWSLLSGAGRRKSIDVNITNFHPLPPGIEDRDLLRSIGVNTASDIVAPPAIATHRVSAGAMEFVPSALVSRKATSSATRRRRARRTQRRRWSLPSSSPRWSTSSKSRRRSRSSRS